MQLQQPQPGQAVFDANALFSGITRENFGQKLAQLKANATFENLEKVAAAVEKFKPSNEIESQFKKEVLKYTLSYRIGETAKKDVNLTAEEIIKKYGKYTYRKNDCYTYIMKVTDAMLNDLKEDKRFRVLRNPAGTPYIPRYTQEEFDKLETTTFLRYRNTAQKRRCV